jgi:hypothetical protein
MRSIPGRAPPIDHIEAATEPSRDPWGEIGPAGGGRVAPVRLPEPVPFPPGPPGAPEPELFPEDELLLPDPPPCPPPPPEDGPSGQTGGAELDEEVDRPELQV